MRTAIVGLALCAGVMATVTAVPADGNRAWGQYPPGTPAVGAMQAPAGGAASGMLAFSTPAGEGRQQIVVIDPATHVMSVYHIDVASGAIKLKSVRNLTWDLRLLQFNNEAPLPEEIRVSLEP